MKTEVKNIIDEYLRFTGLHDARDFAFFLRRVAKAMIDNLDDDEAFIKLGLIFTKLEHGLEESIKHGQIVAIVQESESDIERYYEKRKGKDLGKVKLRKSSELGKLVDEGDIPYHRSRADQYWKDKKINLIFDANNRQVRSGPVVPKSYEYSDIDFIERHFDFKGIEFGNWLSQQDRKNYLAGLGLSLFDLHHVLGFSAKQLSLKGKITVAFGARGRGSALAHFEPDTFAINITRYKRPKAGQRNNLHRLLTASGGVGSFAHEFGHALDYYGGYFIARQKEALTGGRSLRVMPHKKTMDGNGLPSLMEKLLYRIIWDKEGKHTAYYQRMMKLKKNQTLTDYHLRRNEIFARAFESYVHYKMNKKKYKNIFLAETKYDYSFYLSPTEMRRLEKDFDSLLNAIKKYI